MSLEEWLLGQNVIPLPLVKKKKGFKMESGQLRPLYELIYFFASMQCSVSSNVVVFSENVRDKIREKIICFIYLFIYLFGEEKEKGRKRNNRTV